MYPFFKYTVIVQCMPSPRAPPPCARCWVGECAEVHAVGVLCCKVMAPCATVVSWVSSITAVCRNAVASHPAIFSHFQFFHIPQAFISGILNTGIWLEVTCLLLMLSSCWPPHLPPHSQGCTVR